ncbi:small nuclear ribonucleoprotein [Pyronema domesticum]|nr:small nuclear ribonucleoprotein [Pyronema domesticum]
MQLTRISKINYRMRVTVSDSRQLTGTLLAFDKHMNVVLADTEEFRRIKRKPAKAAANQASTIVEEKRTLGLIILRGHHIISMSVEGPPAADPSTRLGATPVTSGPGIARPAGRGLPIMGLAPPAPGGLQGPMRNVGLGQGPPGFGAPPAGFPGAPPPGFQAPPGFGRGFPGAPPPGFQGR